MVEQSGTALLLEQICNHHEDNIMPLGAFKAALMGTAGTATTGDVVLLATTAASSDSTISFTSGINSTYGEYIFRFYNIHPSENSTSLQFQVNADGESDYNETITSTYFRAYHQESDGGTPTVAYESGTDQAQGTAFQFLTNVIPNNNDDSCAGELHIFNPASTTYVKHYYSKLHHPDTSPHAMIGFGAGYINTTGAITQVQFKMNSGNIDAGTIKMWGVK